MGGGKFAAAYQGPVSKFGLPRKTTIPDHKLYFVPCDTEAEAAYLTAFLNAPVVSEAVGAYASKLSLGTSVVEYLNIPRFDPADEGHSAIAALGAKAQKQSTSLPQALPAIDEAVRRLLNL